MVKVFLFVAAVLCVSPGANAQKAKTLSKVIALKIDRNGGANGAGVAWHPEQNRYYAAQAGNENFPLLIYDANGFKVGKDDQKTLFDMRGIWYNPKTKTLQMNGYNNGVIAEYKLDNFGMPVGVTKLSVTATQPDPQCAGVYDSKKNAVCFYDYSSGGIEQHNMETGATGKAIPIYYGAKIKSEIKKIDRNKRKENYNQNAIAYTGIPHAEVGLLNIEKNQIELYDLTTGLMDHALKLPDSAPVEPSLNFCYSNGIYWLFDKVKREWDGYKLK